MRRAALPLLTAALLGLTACSPVLDQATPGRAATPPTVTAPAGADPSTPPSSPSPSPVPSPPTATATLAPHDLWVFPGPDVYASDDLDVEVPTFGTSAPDVEDLEVTWDGERVGVDAQALVDPIVGGRFAFDLPVELAPGPHVLEVSATVDGDPLERRRDVTVRPSSERSDGDLVWTSVDADCCTLHAPSGSQVGRRLAEVAADLDRAASPVAERFGVALDDPGVERIDIVVLANPWGNGGFANDERIVLALPVRNPAPADPGTLYVHELTHVLQGWVATAPTAFEEGLAVQTAGGHYAVTDLRAEAAALAASDNLQPLEELYDGFRELQHERRYLQAAAFVEWVTDAHGEEALQAILRHEPADDDVAASAWLDGALQEAVGIDLQAADAAFTAWLEDADPEAVADATIGDLVRLQELRRRWQSTYAPWEALYDELHEIEDLADLDPARAVRRPASDAHVAVETVFAAAQRAQATGDRELVARLLGELGRVVDTSRIDAGLPAQHLAVVRALDLPAGEVTAIEIADGSATVTSADGAATTLQLRDGAWQPA